MTLAELYSAADDAHAEDGVISEMLLRGKIGERTRTISWLRENAKGPSLRDVHWRELAAMLERGVHDEVKP